MWHYYYYFQRKRYQRRRELPSKTKAMEAAERRAETEMQPRAQNEGKAGGPVRRGGETIEACAPPLLFLQPQPQTSQATHLR